eukprot:470127_1
MLTINIFFLTFFLASNMQLFLTVMYLLISMDTSMNIYVTDLTERVHAIDVTNEIDTISALKDVISNQTTISLPEDRQFDIQFAGMRLHDMGQQLGDAGIGAESSVSIILPDRDLRHQLMQQLAAKWTHVTDWAFMDPILDVFEQYPGEKKICADSH